MTKAGNLIWAALAAGIVLGGVLMWTIRPPNSNSGVRTDATTIYCADPANSSSLHRAMAALGSGVSYQRACNALVELSDPALEDSSAPTLTWQSIVLGSSVLAALVTAVFNVRSTALAARRTRIDSLTDAAFAIYKDFNREAHEYVDVIRSQKKGRPSADNLKGYYEELNASLRRLPGPMVQDSLESARECYMHLSDWPTGQDPNRSDHLRLAGEKLDKLSKSMRDLEDRLLEKAGPAKRGAH